MIFTIWGISKLLIRFSKQFGIDWLKKNFNLDPELSKLAYDTIEDPEKFGDLLYYLHANKNSVEAIENKISQVEKLDEVKNQPNLLRPGSKTDIYKDLMEEVFYIVVLRKHTIVLEGFLNGIEYISYFAARAGKPEITKTEGCISLNAFAEIKIEKIANSEERLRRVKKQRARTEDRRVFNQYEDLLKPNYTVRHIYDNYFEVEKEYDYLSSKKEVDIENSEFNIPKDYAGFLAMKASLQAYIDEIIADVSNLQSLAK